MSLYKRSKNKVATPQLKKKNVSETNPRKKSQKHHLWTLSAYLLEVHPLQQAEEKHAWSYRRFPPYPGGFWEA